MTTEGEAGWIDLLEANPRRFGGSPDCTPGYYNNAGYDNNEGQDSGRRGPLNSLGYHDGPVAYFDYIDRWRQTGDFAGLEFRAR